MHFECAPQLRSVSSSAIGCTRDDRLFSAAYRLARLCVRALVSVLLLAAAPAHADDPEISGATCNATETVELQRTVRFSEPSERVYARRSAIRLAVVDALQQAAGADISRSSQTTTTSSRTAIERETREHLVVRSGGRVTGWEVTNEQIITDTDDDGRLLRVTLRVDVCPSPDAVARLVVSIADPVPLASGISQEIRARLAEFYSYYDNLTVVRKRPQDTFHDVRIEFDHTVAIEDRDNSDKADTLKKFGGSDLLDDRALRFQLVTVTTTAKAVRFVDEVTSSQTVERRRRIPFDAPTEEAVQDLILEASMMAGRAVGEKLGAGDLDYFDR